jgi:hypothetical protein
MASKTQKDILKKLKKPMAKGSLTPKESSYNAQSQVDNLKERMKGSGIDPDEAMDTRGFLGKAFNLTPDQNFFFDVFEVLERPQQALFNAWEAKQDGGDIKEALKAGISGNSVVRFKEILHNYGMEDSEKKFGVDDVAGFLGDILLDPIDVPFIPAKAGASAIAKAARGAEDAGKVLSNLKKVGAGVDTLKTAEDALKAANRGVKAANKNRLIAPIQGVFRGAGKGIKGTLKITDAGIEKILSKMDAVSEVHPNITKSKKALESLDSYRNFKSRLKQVFAAAKEVPASIMDTYRKNSGKQHWTTAQLGAMQEGYVDKFAKMAKKIDMPEDELGKTVQGLIEYSKYKPKISIQHILENPKGEIALKQNNVDEIKDFIKKSNIDLGSGKDGELSLFRKLTTKDGTEFYQMTDNGHKTLREALKDVDMSGGYAKTARGADEQIEAMAEGRKIIRDKRTIRDVYSAEFDAPRFYSEQEIKRYDGIIKNDLEMMQFVEESDQFYQSMVAKVDEIMGTAMERGTPKGYLAHGITDQRKAVPLKRSLEFDSTIKGSKLKGNVNTFTGRKYKMSAEEANKIYKAKIEDVITNDNTFLSKSTKEYWKSQEGMNLFNDSINMSIGDFIDTAPKFAKDAKQLDNVLISSFLQDNDMIMGIEEGKKIGINKKQIKKTDLTDKLKTMKPYMPKEVQSRFDEIVKIATSKFDGNDIAIDKTLFEMVGRLGERTELKELARFVDVMNNAFKKFKLMSPGFQMRNIIGNSSNMYLAGMSPKDIGKFSMKADGVLKKGDNLLKKVTREGKDSLKGADKETYEWYKKFIENDFHNVSKEVFDVENIIKENKSLREKWDLVDRAAQWNFAMNQKMDERFRLAMLMWAEKNPQKYLDMGLESPGAIVRHTLFDPKDISGAEREVLKRFVPFYTFTKKNLAFQMKNIFDNPRKYNHLRKTIRSTWETFTDMDYDDLEGYKKENFWIPIPGLSKGDKYTALKINLPMGDMAEFLSNPLRRGYSSLAPIMKAPPEILTNKQIFTGQTISDFKGQNGYQLPWASKKVEYGLGQIGLDVPLSLGTDLGRTGLQAAKGELEGKSTGEVIRDATGRSMFSAGSVEKSQTSKAYQELEQIRELMKYYKQENIDILTLSEIENKNNNQQMLSSRLRGILSKYR